MYDKTDIGGMETGTDETKSRQTTRDGAVAARLAHTQEAGGSSPSPATKTFSQMQPQPDKLEFCL